MFNFSCDRLWLKRFFITLLLCHAMAIFAEEPNLNFRHYTINEGLSQNTVFCLLEDRDGIIWMGTADGLNKFDGYDFKYYKHEFRNAYSISNNQINALYEDKSGKIWIGTADGLNVFDKHTEKFSRLSTTKSPTLTSNDFITSIYEDSKGNIWITSQEGLKLYNEMGEAAANALFSLLSRKTDLSDPELICLSSELIVRESSGGNLTLKRYG